MSYPYTLTKCHTQTDCHALCAQLPHAIVSGKRHRDIGTTSKLITNFLYLQDASGRDFVTETQRD
jgi:hypothetical protein